MTDHWIRTWKLIRERPTLIVPAIIASLFGLGMQRLSKVALKLIVQSFATGHSVLEVEVPNGDLGNLQHRAMLVVIPLGLAREFLTILVFVAALVVTARQVRVAVDGALPEVPASQTSTPSPWRSSLLFSLVFMALMGSLNVLGSAALTFPATLAYLWPQTFYFSVLVSSVITRSLMAWFLAPWSVRLLQRPESALTASVKKSARVFAMFAFAPQPVIRTVLIKFEVHAPVPQKWESTGISVLNTTVTNLPLALLFVALGLLAMEPASATTVDSEGQSAPLPLAVDESAGPESVNEA